MRSTRIDTDHEALNLAKNFATSIDQNLTARIGALQILAISPHADRAENWKELYQEALGYHQGFGSATSSSPTWTCAWCSTRECRSVHRCRTLPIPKGNAAAPMAAKTGKPAVGDIFFGPIAKEPMVAVAVPGMRNGKLAFILLSTFETRLFQGRIEQVSLPTGWSLALVDGNGETIARHGPPGLNAATDVDTDGRFAVKTTVAPWTVVLEIPRDAYRAPLVAAGGTLAAAIVGVTLTSVLGGMLASRRLARSVALLADPRADGGEVPNIAEFATVHRTLAESANSRQAAESALRESERRFRATFEQAAVGIAMVAPDGQWLDVNTKQCEITGYRRDELLARTFQDITHPDDVAADEAHVRRLLAGEVDTCKVEKRYIRKDGSTVWINLTASLVRRPDGSPDYFISVVEDIQRRKESDAALKASEARLNFATQKSRTGAWELNLVDHSAHRTLTHDQIFGYPALLPLWTYEIFLEHVLPEDRADVDRKFREAVAAHSDWTFECRIRRADGEVRWIWAAGGHERDADGNVVRMAGIVQDITERKQAEEAIRVLNDELELRVARAHRATRGRQQGTRRVRVFRFARPARAAADDRRIRPRAGGGLRGQAGCRGAGLPETGTRRVPAHDAAGR